MSGAELNFDANQYEPDEGYELIPAGWYNMRIVESEMKATSNGDGAYLEIQFQVMDGNYVNRKVYTRLNLRNQNHKAVEIANRQLSSIARACGVMYVKNSQQLHGIPLKCKVRVRKDKTGEYEDQNEISSYKAIEGQVTSAAQPSAPAGWGQQQPTAPPGWGQPVAPQQAPIQQAPMQQVAPQQVAPQQVAVPTAPQPWAQPAAIQQAPPQQVTVTAPQPWAQPVPQQADPQQAPPQQVAVTAPQQAAPQPAWAQQQVATEVQPQVAVAEPQTAAPAAPHPAQSAVPPWQQQPS